MKKILVMYKIPTCGFDELADEFEVVYPQGEKFTEQEWNMHIQDAYALVSVFGCKLTRDIIDRAVNLKLIANFGVGYDNIDIPYVTAKGITVTNTPDPVTEPTAELAMGLMVAVCRKIGYLNNQLRKPGGLVTGVMKNLSSTLSGKTLGIIGMGAIGQALAHRAVSFGMKIIYYNRKRLPEDIEKRYQAAKVDFAQLLKESDVVSLNCPLTEQTYHLIGEEQLYTMKNTAFLINTARGSVVDEKALVSALKNHVIAGAGLDVYENEPYIPHELLNMDQVVLTPHTGTATLETREEMSRFVAEIIRKFYNGTLNSYIVNG